MFLVIWHTSIFIPSLGFFFWGKYRPQMMGMQCLIELCGPKMTLNFNAASVRTGLVMEGTAREKCIYDDVENFWVFLFVSRVELELEG